MFETKYQNQDLKKMSQFVSRTGHKSQLDINNTLAVYFTEQFLTNIKTQISQKTKPSKSILEALKHSNSQLIQYKKQIQELKTLNSVLKTQNSQLLQTISKLKQKQPQPQITNKQQKRKAQNLKACFSKCIHIEGNEQNYEIIILKEKMNHLEQIKKMKETRLHEMIDKQSKLVAEIDMLKYKNQMLSQTVNCLQETVKDISRHSYQPQIQEQIVLVKNDSKEAQFVKNYINVDIVNQTQNNSFLNVAREGDRRYSLAISCTKNVQIEEQFNIEIQAIKHSKEARQAKNSDFMEIDGLLQQYLPQTNTCQNISSNGDISQQGETNMLMQSHIQIMIDK